MSGPFTPAPGDSQWVMIALLVARDQTSRLAVARLRQKADALRDLTCEQLTAPTDVDLRPYLGIPTRYDLQSNYPNPFRDRTVLSCDLPEEATVSVDVYDVLGRRVRVLVKDAREPRQRYQIEWDGRGDAGRLLPSGIYFIELRVRGAQQEQAFRRRVVHLR